MLHPSYSDLMEVVNSEVEHGEHPVVQSRYSIVLATAKRARQIIAGEQSVFPGKGKKPLSMAVEELYKGKIKIVGDEETDEEENAATTDEVINEETEETEAAEEAEENTEE